MAKNNKICALCGTAYKYCSNCDDFLKYPNWKGIFCCEECFNVYEAMSAFEGGQADKKAVKAIFMAYRDSGKYKNYKNSFANTYAKVMADDEIENEKEFIPEKTIDDLKDEPVEHIEEVKKNTEKTLAQKTASEVKNNITSEAKKTYPKAVAHKHGK